MVKGSHHTKESIEKMSNSQVGVLKGPMGQSTKDKIAAFRTGTISSQDTRIKLSVSHSGKTFSDETRKRMSDSHKELWKDLEYARRVMHRRALSKPEQMYIDYCLMIGKDMKFVGNGALIIDGKNPDFVDSTGKKFVEIWGDFFHKGQNPKDRIKFFEDRGYECHVIWASELKQLFRMAQTSPVC